MRVVIIAPGSRGDIQPYIALGEGLRGAGHSICIVTNEDWTALVGAHGLEVRPVAINVQAAMQAKEASASIEGGGLLSSFRTLAAIAKRSGRLLMEEGLAASQGADLLLAGFGGMLVGASVAEKRGLPFVQAYNVPLTPTAAFPGALLPRLSVWPRSISHRLSHALTRQFVWQAARMAGNGARAEVLGLRPAPFGGMWDHEVLRRGPLLYGFSPSVLPRPADWDARVEVTGYWFSGEPADFAPPADLVRFLDGGPPPVYVGFGSMSTERPEETMRLVLDALAKKRRRAIVHAGWAGLSASSLPDHVHVIGSVPHGWLFSRVAAVVHHGGAGTTASGLRAGVPSVIVPFHGDQPFWGRVVETLGVGPRPVPRTRLTSERLAGAIESAVSDEAMRARAAALGARIRGEDGVASAVSSIEAFARRGFRR